MSEFTPERRMGSFSADSKRHCSNKPPLWLWEQAVTASRMDKMIDKGVRVALVRGLEGRRNARTPGHRLLSFDSPHRAFQLEAHYQGPCWLTKCSGQKHP